MPTYEYICDNCAHRFEKFQGILEEPLRICPLCSGLVKRLVSGGVGILFKGSGFHSTDYKAENMAVNKTRCGKEQTCCGRAVPCDKPGCEK